METTKNRTAILSKVLRIVYVGVLLLHFLMWALDVKGQSLLPINAQPKYPLVESRRNTVREIYTSQIGVREKQPNSGPEVEKYLRYVNLPKGNPWCAAFVCWSLGEAGVENPRTGWSPGLFGERYIVWSKKDQGSRSKEQRPDGEARAKNQESRLGGGIQDGFRQNGIEGINLLSRSAYPPSLATDNWELATPGPADVLGLLFPDWIGDLVTTRGQSRMCQPTHVACKNCTPHLQLRWRLLNPGNLKCAVDAGFAASAGDPRPSRGTAFAACTPRTADVFGLYFPEKGRIAHVGFVDDWQDPWVTTVEGNTNVLGSREGDGVYRKRRLVRSIYKVARYIN